MAREGLSGLPYPQISGAVMTRRTYRGRTSKPAVHLASITATIGRRSCVCVRNYWTRIFQDAERVSRIGAANLLPAITAPNFCTKRDYTVASEPSSGWDVATDPGLREPRSRIVNLLCLRCLGLGLLRRSWPLRPCAGALRAPASPARIRHSPEPREYGRDLPAAACCAP
jgi:hypothetical protein